MYPFAFFSWVAFVFFSRAVCFRNLLSSFSQVVFFVFCSYFFILCVYVVFGVCVCVLLFFFAGRIFVYCPFLAAVFSIFLYFFILGKRRKNGRIIFVTIKRQIVGLDLRTDKAHRKIC